VDERSAVGLLDPQAIPARSARVEVGAHLGRRGDVELAIPVPV
jgi:hypothetical protein